MDTTFPLKPLWHTTHVIYRQKSWGNNTIEECFYFQTKVSQIFNFFKDPIISCRINAEIHGENDSLAHTPCLFFFEKDLGGYAWIVFADMCTKKCPLMLMEGWRAEALACQDPHRHEWKFNFSLSKIIIVLLIVYGWWLWSCKLFFWKG